MIPVRSRDGLPRRRRWHRGQPGGQALIVASQAEGPGQQPDRLLGPAKRVNPKALLIIKYPQWYDHFHERGYEVPAASGASRAAAIRPASS